MEDITAILFKVLAEQKRGRSAGIYPVCSANRFVLEASLLQAKADNTAVCLESTSNQVNHFGGYTGMTPAQFVRFVEEVAIEAEFPRHRILLGGDHLGPHVWRNQSSAPAMANACELVRQCVLAGYTKIHLDTSMRCADDPGDEHSPLEERLVTERAALLCQVAEQAHSGLPGDWPPPVYVIGTEVPKPGGEQGIDAGPSVTRPEDVERTISLTHQAFQSRKLDSAWDRVIALVVQPGVEFGDTVVFDYDRCKARQISSLIEREFQLVFEAHSTDYQNPEALKRMVEDHFAILKVGPWLTFAFREAIFALAHVEEEWLARRKGIVLSDVRQLLEDVMLNQPSHWRQYYREDEDSLPCALKYSYSDRCRYYWPMPEIQRALSQLFSNLEEHPPPLTLLSQYLPAQYQAVREGRIPNAPPNLVRHKIMEVTGFYSHACTPV